MKAKRLILATILLISCEDKLNWIKIEAPVVYSIEPNAGAAGTTVTITGANFDINPYKNIVTIHKTQALIINASRSVLTFTAPDETTGPVVVTVNNRSAKNQPVFMYR